MHPMCNVDNRFEKRGNFGKSFEKGIKLTRDLGQKLCTREMTDLSDDTAAAGGRDAPNVRSHKNYFSYQMHLRIRCPFISDV